MGGSRTLFQPHAYSLPASSAAMVCRQPPATVVMRVWRSAATRQGRVWSLRWGHGGEGRSRVGEGFVGVGVGPGRWEAGWGVLRIRGGREGRNGEEGGGADPHT